MCEFTRQAGGNAPAGHAESDQAGPPIPVAEGPEHRRGQGVDDEKAGHQRSQLGIGQMQFGTLQAFEQRRDQKSIQIIEQIDESEDGEPPTCGTRPGLGGLLRHDLRHLWNAHGNGGSGVIHFHEHAALTRALRGAHHLGARHGSWNQSASSRPSEAVFVSIHVALNHVTHYRYDRPVSLSPQIVRLRPAPHCRTRILAYSLEVRPSGHFINWQQDPQANYLARLVFPDETREFKIEVDLVAEMSVLNPFDFFLAPHAQSVPFRYESGERRELGPYLAKCAATPLFEDYLAGLSTARARTIDFIVDVNRRVAGDIRYLIRLEPGTQAPDETLAKRSGSCRDSAALLVQLFRHLGVAARFVSGYLIQLVPDVKSLDGPTGASQDFTDLHAWCEVYLPGAGWIGLDPTSGLLAGEGHIPLACSPEPAAAAPISGSVDECETQFEHHMSVRRIWEAPRVTKPYRDAEWSAIQGLGRAVDADLAAMDVRLTMAANPRSCPSTIRTARNGTPPRWARRNAGSPPPCSSA